MYNFFFFVWLCASCLVPEGFDSHFPLFHGVLYWFNEFFSSLKFLLNDEVMILLPIRIYFWNICLKSIKVAHCAPGSVSAKATPVYLNYERTYLRIIVCAYFLCFGIVDLNYMFSHSETHANLHMCIYISITTSFVYAPFYSCIPLIYIHTYPVVCVIACTYNRTYVCVYHVILMLLLGSNINSVTIASFNGMLLVWLCGFVFFIAPVRTRCVCFPKVCSLLPLALRRLAGEYRVAR